MNTTTATAEPALVGALVLTPTGQCLGNVRAVSGASFWVAPAAADEGVWLPVERIRLFSRGRVYLAAA